MQNDKSAMSRAYQKALSRLRSRHDEEFHAILADVYADLGMAVTKRASRAQAARRRLEDAKRVIDETSTETP